MLQHVRCAVVFSALLSAAPGLHAQETDKSATVWLIVDELGAARLAVETNKAAASSSLALSISQLLGCTAPPDAPYADDKKRWTVWVSGCAPTSSDGLKHVTLDGGELTALFHAVGVHRFTVVARHPLSATEKCSGTAFHLGLGLFTQCVLQGNGPMANLAVVYGNTGRDVLVAFTFWFLCWLLPLVGLLFIRRDGAHPSLFWRHAWLASDLVMVLAWLINVLAVATLKPHQMVRLMFADVFLVDANLAAAVFLLPVLGLTLMAAYRVWKVQPASGAPVSILRFVMCFSSMSFMALLLPLLHAELDASLASWVAAAAVVLIATMVARIGLPGRRTLVVDEALMTRVRTLAAGLHVPVRQVSWYAGARSVLSQAPAYRLGYLFLSEDLVSQLSPREVDACLAMVLAPCKRSKTAVLLVGWVVMVVLVSQGALLATLGVALAVLTVAMFRGRRDLDAKALKAAQLTRDHEAVISALTHLAGRRAVVLPWQVGTVRNAARAAALRVGRALGVAEARVEELVQHGLQGEPPMHVTTQKPADVRSARARTLQMYAPVIVIPSVGSWFVGGIGQTVGLALVASALAYWAAVVVGRKRQREGIAESTAVLKVAGMVPPADALWAHVVPGRALLGYPGGKLGADLGVVFACSDGLAFWGASSRFFIPRAAVLRVFSGGSALVARRTFVEYRSATGDILTLALLSPQGTKGAVALKTALHRWQTGDVGNDLPEGLKDAGLPAYSSNLGGPLTSQISAGVIAADAAVLAMGSMLLSPVVGTALGATGTAVAWNVVYAGLGTALANALRLTVIRISVSNVHIPPMTGPSTPAAGSSAP